VLVKAPLVVRPAMRPAMAAFPRSVTASHQRRISLLDRRESSHPSIRQILNNIRSKNVFTELLLLNEVQSL
jgi:hypothetical protein